MLTLRQLFLRTKELRWKVNPTAAFRIKDVVPIPVGNALLVRARYNALTDKTMQGYDVTLVFHGLPMALQRDSNHPLSVEVTPGVFVYMKKASFSDTKVGVSCDCKDYYYVAWYYNMLNGNHSGANLKPYVRKTAPPPLGRPYANPLKVPFCCKHIVRLAKHLSDQGFINP